MPTHFVALCACRLRGSHPLLCNIIGGRLFTSCRSQTANKLLPALATNLHTRQVCFTRRPRQGEPIGQVLYLPFLLPFCIKKYFLNFQKVFLCCFCFYNKLLIFLLYDFLKLSTTKFIFKLKHNLF